MVNLCPATAKLKMLAIIFSSIKTENIGREMVITSFLNWLALLAPDALEI